MNTSFGRNSTRPEQPQAAAFSVGEELPETGRQQAPRLAEDTLALLFTERHADNLRYVATWSRWMRWDGCRWGTDATLHVFDLVRDLCREASVEFAETPASASKTSSAATVAAVERLARTDRRHAAMIEQWDSDPWLLNTPGGRVNLHTGELSEHRRSDYCTRMTAATPGGSCPQWLIFLERITAGNQELQAFLQRVAGYCLTGVTFEHALFFLYGTGANGKSVFLTTLSGMLHEYSKTAPIDTFTTVGKDQHPTDLAGLQGARLITAIEVEEGRRWAESKIKTLTGGDRIAARFMRQDFFEFTPQFKLIVAGNHRPGLRSVDEAIRRRLYLVPFTVTIPAADRDAELVAKLRTEWNGVLAWALQGCLDWQRHGLKPPDVIRAATEDYFAAEDDLKLWIDECCETAPGNSSSCTELYGSWKRWREATGEPAESQKCFSQNLEAKGFPKDRQGGSGRSQFHRIGLRRLP